MPEFRPLTQSDMQEIYRLWSSLGEHYDHPIGGDWTPVTLLAELQTGFGIGAFDDAGKMQAFCFYRGSDGLKEIILLVTDSRLHRGGAMRSLVRSLILDLEPNEKIWLEVHAGNLPAIGLYESLGFRLCGERLNYYSDGGKALLYEYSASLS